jgi:predicted nucleic acid-binding protein
VIYLDSSALVKMIRVEAESVALIGWLNARGAEPLTASVLVEVEVPRALRRSQPGVLAGVSPVLARLHRIEMNAAVRAAAAAYVDPLLRSLDAIHLATAENLVAAGQSISAFVTYDERLAGAATDVGLDVHAPA